MQNLRLMVTGLIGSLPLPGLTYHYLQYVLGLRALGHEVHYLEDTGQWNYDPVSDGMLSDGEGAAAYLSRVMADHGMAGKWTFVNHDGGTFGCGGRRFETLCRTADALINVTGANLLRPEYLSVPHRVYLDTDPGYVQFRADMGNRNDLAHLSAHSAHATFGLNVNGADCTIPRLGHEWHPTRQPIVQDLWQRDAPPRRRTCVTVMKWHTYAPVEHGGQSYGDKSSELQKFLELPSRVDIPLELAVLGPGPRTEFESRGWQWNDASEINRSLASYREFLNSAAAEWTVAKNGYVRSRSGWIGDRTASMLTMGRPVVLQGTGWEKFLPSDRGLLSFNSVDEASAALEDVWARYEFHARAARDVADAYFAAPVVLNRLLEDALV